MSRVSNKIIPAQESYNAFVPKKALSSNPGAALAAVRWDNATEEQKEEEGRRLAAARNVALTPERRAEIAKKAAQTRWGKTAKKKAK